MQKVMAKDELVEVCAIYLPSEGVGAEVMIDGIGMDKPPKMAARFLGNRTRIVSF